MLRTACWTPPVVLEWQQLEGHQSKSFPFPQSLGKKGWEILGKDEDGGWERKGAAAGAGALWQMVTFQCSDGSRWPLVCHQMYLCLQASMVL